MNMNEYITKFRCFWKKIINGHGPRSTTPCTLKNKERAHGDQEEAYDSWALARPRPSYHYSLSKANISFSVPSNMN